jgi:hypothetical protein
MQDGIKSIPSCIPDGGWSERGPKHVEVINKIDEIHLE